MDIEINHAIYKRQFNIIREHVSLNTALTGYVILIMIKNYFSYKISISIMPGDALTLNIRRRHIWHALAGAGKTGAHFTERDWWNALVHVCPSTFLITRREGKEKRWQVKNTYMLQLSGKYNIVWLPRWWLSSFTFIESNSSIK